MTIEKARSRRRAIGDAANVCGGCRAQMGGDCVRACVRVTVVVMPWARDDDDDDEDDDEDVPFKMITALADAGGWDATRRRD